MTKLPHEELLQNLVGKKEKANGRREMEWKNMNLYRLIYIYINNNLYVLYHRSEDFGLILLVNVYKE